jgi:hypothetical protein
MLEYLYVVMVSAESDCFSFDFISDIPDDSSYGKYADYILKIILMKIRNFRQVCGLDIQRHYTEKSTTVNLFILISINN